MTRPSLIKPRSVIAVPLPLRKNPTNQKIPRAESPRRREGKKKTRRHAGTKARSADSGLRILDRINRIHMIRSRQELCPILDSLLSSPLRLGERHIFPPRTPDLSSSASGGPDQGPRVCTPAASPLRNARAWVKAHLVINQELWPRRRSDVILSEKSREEGNNRHEIRTRHRL